MNSTETTTSTSHPIFHCQITLVNLKVKAQRRVVSERENRNIKSWHVRHTWEASTVLKWAVKFSWENKGGGDNSTCSKEEAKPWKRKRKRKSKNKTGWYVDSYGPMASIFYFPIQKRSPANIWQFCKYKQYHKIPLSLNQGFNNYQVVCHMWVV